MWHRPVAGRNRKPKKTMSDALAAGSRSLMADLAGAARMAPASGIAEVHQKALGLGRPVIKFWVGEGSLPTPGPIVAAATASLALGETFYTHQAGLPELRTALAAYHDRLFGGLFGRPFDPARFVVTASGMHAITLAVAMTTGAGDEVIVPTPAWPNAAAAFGVHGAVPREVPMRLGNAGWDLDLDAVAAAIGPRTRAIAINSPSNPLGWVASRNRLAELLALARRAGLWIIADEVYGRFCYLPGETLAPSFHDVVEPDDRVIFVNTFSKNWAMTGWRIGWIEVPAALSPTVENLIQYSSSGTPVFVQRAAIVALREGESFVEAQLSVVRANRAILIERLGATGRVRLSPPDGAFYLFLAIDGENDTRSLCLRLLDEIGVGLAPGSAFGAGGSGFMRLCFAGDGGQLSEGVDRLSTWIGKRFAGLR
jgi:aspartate/methionine/tyrosine aminotransferase